MIAYDPPKPQQPNESIYAPSQTKEIFSALAQGSYFANRSYGMAPEAYAKLFNWSEDLMNQYESAYQAMIANIENENRYKRLIEDLNLIEDENFTNQ